MENLNVNENEEVLEIGTGCGFIAIQIAKKVKKIVATDISEDAIRSAILNSKINSLMDNIDFRKGNLFGPIQEGELFDLIIFNSPYLPTSKEEKIEGSLDFAWNGGLKGRSIIDEFINQSPNYLKNNGRILLIQSSITGIEKTINKFNKMGLQTKILAEKKFFFEKIILIESKQVEKNAYKS